MNFKSKSFDESEVMRSFAKVALEKGLVKVSAKKKIDLEPTNDLETNLLKLALGLRKKGLVSQAELVESKIKSYLAASVKLSDTLKDVHPNGVQVFNGELGKVETLDEIQDKFLALINKKASILDEAHPDGSVDLFDGNELGVIETLDDEHDKILKILNKRAAKNILNTVHPKGVQVFEGELGKVETLDEIQERFLKLIKKAELNKKSIENYLVESFNNLKNVCYKIYELTGKMADLANFHDAFDIKNFIRVIDINIRSIIISINDNNYKDSINNLLIANNNLKTFTDMFPKIYAGKELERESILKEPWFKNLKKGDVIQIQNLRVEINKLILLAKNMGYSLDVAIDSVLDTVRKDLNDDNTQQKNNKVETFNSDDSKKKNHPKLLAFYNELLSKKQAIVAAASKGMLNNNQIKFYINKVKETQNYLTIELTDKQVDGWIPAQKKDLNIKLEDAGVSF